MSSSYSSSSSVDDLMMTESYEDKASNDDGDSEYSCSLTDDNHEKTEATNQRDLVHGLRMGVLIVLLVVAAVSVYAAYGTASKVEQDEFKKTFEAEAFKVHAAIHRRESQQKGVIQALTNQITSYALASESHWPLVALPEVDKLFSTYLELGKFVGVFFSPIIEPHLLSEWEALCQQNLDWLPQASLKTNSTFLTDPFCEIELSTTVRTDLRLAFWQYAPIVDRLPEAPIFEQLRISLNETIISKSASYPMSESNHSHFMNSMLSVRGSYEAGEPISIFTSPVYENFDTVSKARAVVVAPFALRNYLENTLPDSAKGLVCVLKNPLGEAFTFEINGGTAEYVGSGDRHDPVYDGYAFDAHLFKHKSETSVHKFDAFYVTIYPSIAFEAEHKTKTPVVNAIFMFALFAFTTLVFLVYDCCVERRQRKITTKVNTATAVVSSLFPEGVGQQLLREAGEMNKNSSRMEEAKQESKEAIADFFPDVTIMFSDIKGFTAWSSSREPAQVFSLLGAIFGAFDELARRRGVFKVETVGDQYVAVAGLPKPVASHAVVMTRFAKDCLLKMTEVIHSLEVSLGPDTAELSMRFGLHSGCVTAGVLRGDKARFQLFGDAMNVASRMESTGEPGRIQISEATAQLLREANKEDWLTPRKDLVYAKGKGNLQTYWLQRSGVNSSSEHTSRGAEDEEPNKAWTKTERLVVWNCELLKKVLKKIEKKRRWLGISPTVVPNEIEYLTDQADVHLVVEKVEMPLFNPAVGELFRISTDVDLKIGVETQLLEFVSEIASLYNDNPFHDFSHASHVMMAVNKLMTRVVDSKDALEVDTEQLHLGAYGITSDPLTQFACLLAALGHDADHPGVSNETLKKEKPDLATKYKGKSIAEKISLDHVWAVLIQDKYAELRKAIYCNKEEFLRFRQLLVNSVMATDIQDTQLRELNYKRWEKAFNADNQAGLSSQEVMNQRAAVVVQYLMQASDVSHMMQHWHVYRKWNEKLFFEVRKAFDNGRIEKDPALSWYQGELGFFDHWIIPMAVRLKQCGAFGVASSECLDYATQNRNEWEKKGHAEIEQMITKYEDWKSSTDTGLSFV